MKVDPCLLRALAGLGISVPGEVNNEWAFPIRRSLFPEALRNF
jgi:hypothetical protein